MLGLSVRAIGFYDTNLTWFRSLPDQTSPLARLDNRGNGGFRDFLPDTPSGIVRDSWHNGIGGGIRLYMRGVILPLLGRGLRLRPRWQRLPMVHFDRLDAGLGPARAL